MDPLHAMTYRWQLQNAGLKGFGNEDEAGEEDEAEKGLRFDGTLESGKKRDTIDDGFDSILYGTDDDEEDDFYDGSSSGSRRRKKKRHLDEDEWIMAVATSDDDFDIDDFSDEDDDDTDGLW